MASAETRDCELKAPHDRRLMLQFRGSGLYPRPNRGLDGLCQPGLLVVRSGDAVDFVRRADTVLVHKAPAARADTGLAHKAAAAVTN